MSRMNPYPTKRHSQQELAYEMTALEDEEREIENSARYKLYNERHSHNQSRKQIYGLQQSNQHLGAEVVAEKAKVVERDGVMVGLKEELTKLKASCAKLAAEKAQLVYDQEKVKESKSRAENLLERAQKMFSYNREKFRSLQLVYEYMPVCQLDYDESEGTACYKVDKLKRMILDTTPQSRHHKFALLALLRRYVIVWEEVTAARDKCSQFNNDLAKINECDEAEMRKFFQAQRVERLHVMNEMKRDYPHGEKLMAALQSKQTEGLVMFSNQQVVRDNIMKKSRSMWAKLANEQIWLRAVEKCVVEVFGDLRSAREWVDAYIKDSDKPMAIRFEDYWPCHSNIELRRCFLGTAGLREEEWLVIDTA